MSKLYVYVPWHLGPYVSACVPEGVSENACHMQCKYMLVCWHVLWGACEAVCPLSAYVIM